MSTKGYVIFNSEVFKTEEKEPFWPSGKSISGGFEYDPESGRLRCHECGEWFRRIGRHLTNSHPISKREYASKHQVRMSSMSSPEYKNAFCCKPAPAGLLASARLRVENGEAATYGGASRPKTSEQRNINGTCKAQVLVAIRTKAELFGNCPRFLDMPTKYRESAVHWFGSWNDACRAAGVEPNRSPVKVTETEALETLRDFYVLNKRVPKSTDCGRSARLYNKRIYTNLFGGWRQAIASAGFAIVAVSGKGRYEGYLKEKISA